MKSIAVFTIASKNYLSYVRTLLGSIGRIHPEYRLYLCLADRADGYFDPSKEPYTIVEAGTLGINNFEDMTLRYDIMEFNTAVKPFMFRWLFEYTDLDAVIYLDPDIRAYSRFDKLESLLDGGASIVLTPHITRPLEDGKNPNDYHMLQAGVFNLGFIAACRCRETLDFMAWWGRRLSSQCVVDIKGNLFVDQRWCDLAPCFLDDLRVFKDPGYNVAYWNLAQRKVARGATNEWQVGSVPLVFFHFSGVSTDKKYMVSKHQNRLEWDDIPECQPLFSNYLDELRKHGWEVTSKWPYAYGVVSERLALGPLIRRLYRTAFPEPIDLRSSNLEAFLIDLCNQSAKGFPEDEAVRITRLMHLVYQLRPDVQAVFSLATPDGRQAFAAWFPDAGKREYDFPPSLTAPQSTNKPSQPTGFPSNGKHLLVYRTLKVLDQVILHRIWLRLPEPMRKFTSHMWSRLIRWSLREFNKTTEADAGNEFMDQPADIPQLLADRFISNLIYIVWQSRPDLQQAFDLKTEPGQRAFVHWYEVSVHREYGLDPIIPRRRNALSVSGSPADAGASSAGESAKAKCIKGKPGVNLIGYVHAEVGMGEHVRMSAAALSNTEVSYGVVNFNVGVPSRQEATLDHGVVTNSNIYRANLFHINADQMLLTYCRLGRGFFYNHYNIGYWAWELSKCPDEWVTVLGMVDEVWAPSRFIQQAFAERAKVPVEYMPLCVTLPRVDGYKRSHFGLPEGCFLFLFTFDFFSHIERKNPFAAIRAFQGAFPNRTSQVGLVIKVMHGDVKHPQWIRLLELIDNDPRIFILNQIMYRETVLGLYHVCDSFVSLHRSEGFGRGPAEAMYLGKPVIVTNYSGNTDFTLPDNSCLVNYQLIPIAQGQYVFERDQVWADPDVEHAAWYMNKLVSDHMYAKELGSRGQQFVRNNFSPKMIGSIYKQRLQALGLA